MPANTSLSKRHRLVENYSDPSKPNYRPEWWRRCVMHWCKTLDWCGHLDDLEFKDDYLCHVPGEFVEDRKARLQADSPEPFFKDAVNDHASIFTQFEFAEDAPASLVENQDNVDLQGSDMWQWAKEPITAFFRDGGAILGADIDRNVGVGDRRPRLLWVPLRDVFNVEYRDFGGISVWSKVAIRRSINLTDSEGKLLLRNQYWVYELDDAQQCFLTQWNEDEQHNLGEGDTIALVTAANEPLTRLPFTDHLTAIGDLNLDDERTLMSLFADLLALNCEHYNAKSEYNTVKRKTALPTAVVYWPNGVPATPPPFYAGPGKCINMHADGRVEYLELKGESLPILRQSLLDVEQKLAKRDNKLFSAVSGRSATEAEIENQKAKVGLPGIKSVIESAFQDVFQLWELLSNPNPEDVGGIMIGDDVLKTPPNPQDILPYLQAIDRGVSPQAAINAMIRTGTFVKEDFEATDSTGMVPNPDDALPADPNEVIQ